jgi:hypothetical protein
MHTIRRENNDGAADKLQVIVGQKAARDWGRNGAGKVNGLPSAFFLFSPSS